MNNKGIWIGLAAVVIIAGGAVALVNGSKDNTNTKTDTSMQKTMPTSTSHTSNNNSSSSPVSTMAVDIKDFLYSPAAIKVKVGDMVTWTNQDSTSHTVTADTSSADAPSSSTITKGGTYSFSFKKAGTYAYHCNFHGQMKGTVEVTE